MSKRWANRLQLAAFVAVLLSFWPHPTLAAHQSGEWLDHSHIKVGNAVFVDSKNDNSQDYFYLEDPDSCPDEIDDLRQNNTSAHFNTLTPVEFNQGECQNSSSNHPISLSQANRFNDYFVWIDRSRIQTSDGANTFQHSRDNLYLEVGGDSCKDSLEAAPGSTSGRLTPRTGGQSTSYDIGYPFRPGGIRGESGCRVYNTVTVNLGRTANATTAPGTGTPIGGGSSSSTPGTDDKCDAGPGFTFIICGGIHTLTRAINGVEQHVIANFLDVKPLGQRITLDIGGTVKETDDPRYVLWKAFRGLTNGFFVLIFLGIIFANITSINIDAYTIKKMLPKLVVASILVQFSWILSSLAVDVSNVLGKGVFLFINDNLSRVDGAYQFSSFQSGISLGLGTVLAGITASAILYSVLSTGLLLFLLGAFIGLLTLLVTLFIRQILITGMVVLSPLAFVAFVLPNTEGLYRYWSRNFVKLLLMYPIIMLLLASGKVFSVIAAATGGAVAPLFALIALVIPLFIIPTTFKLAGSALSLSSGALGRLTNGRVKGSQFIRDMKAGQRERNVLRANTEGDGLRARLSRGMGKLGSNTLIPTQAGQRRLQSEYAQALRNRGDQYESQFQNNGWSGNRAHMEAIASAKAGDTIDIGGKKFKVDDAAKAKAIELLSRNGEFEVLARVKPVVSDRIWQAGIQRNIGDMLAKAPDLVSGDGAFNNLTAAKVASLHHSTAERLITYLNSPAGAAARPVVMRAVQQVADTPGLRGSIDQRVVGLLTAHRATFSGVTVTHGGTTMSGEDFLNLRAAPNLQTGPDGHRATFSP
jgi:hypothetical protein